MLTKKNRNSPVLVLIVSIYQTRCKYEESLIWKGFPHKFLAMIWGMPIFLKCISQVHVSDMKRVPPHIPSFDLSYASMPPLCLESPTAPDTLSQGDQMTFLLSHACQYSAIFMTSSRKGWGYIVKAVDWSGCCEFRQKQAEPAWMWDSHFPTNYKLEKGLRAVCQKLFML